jgi:uncharacterized iron-regulated membrane protein
MKKLLRTGHRYISLLVSIQLLLWTASGLFFAFNKIQEVRGEHVIKRQPITADLGAFSSVITEARRVRLASRLNQPIVVVTRDGGTDYLDQAGLSVAMLEPHDALSAVDLHTRLTPLSVETVTKQAPGDEFRGRDLPLYRVTAIDQSQTEYNVYINPYSSEVVAIRSLQWRIWDFMWGLHIMDWQAREDINNWPMKFFSVLALISAITGIWLFFAARRASK